MMRVGTAAALLFVVHVQPAGGEEWSRFRGPGGSGVLESANLPVEVGTDRSVRWKVTLPPGHSSPIVAAGRVFLTGFEGETLVTLCVRADDGKILWKRELERPRQERHHDRNNAASPTPVTDGRSLFAFFPDFGLIAYSVDGVEQWRRPSPGTGSTSGRSVLCTASQGNRDARSTVVKIRGMARQELRPGAVGKEALRPAGPLAVRGYLGRCHRREVPSPRTRRGPHSRVADGVPARWRHAGG
jgi:hypothetical protein